MDGSENLTSLTAVGARLMAVRAKQQLSQTQFAQTLGISLRAYQTYEAGQRSIPIESLQALHAAFKSDLNWILLGVSSAEAGHTLRLPEASVAESTLQRLSWLYEQMTVLLGKEFGVSILAEAIGEETAERLEDILAAKCAAPFKILDAIAEYCSANPAWLKHGSGQPFKVTSLYFDYGAQFYSMLTSKPIDTMHILRANTEEGQIAIVKQDNNRIFKTYITTIHLSDKIGATGASHQQEFKETCQKICRGSGNIMGYLLDQDTFLNIISGTCHPVIALKNKNKSYWFSDWWDAEYLERSGEMEEYWPGFNKMVRRIHNKQ